MGLYVEYRWNPFYTITRQPGSNLFEDGPRRYDKEWARQRGPRTRERLGLSTRRGGVTRFVLQLEYRLEVEWRVVVRYDHDEAGTFGHDVTEEGLHVDVFRNGVKHGTEHLMGPLPAGLALDVAEDHLAENVERFVRRFEEWHLK